MASRKNERVSPGGNNATPERVESDEQMTAGDEPQSVRQTPLLSPGDSATQQNGSTKDAALPPVAAGDLPELLLALLLVAPGATTVAELARGSGTAPEAVEAALTELELDLAQAAMAAWVLQRHGDSVQLATAPRFAPYVRRFLNLDREAKLSAAAIETLAIIAYQQPVTRADIEAIRGVDCSGVLATLHSRGLIEQVGRLQAPGNPVQYGTTALFLRHFGLRSLADLPPLGQIEGRDAKAALQEAMEAASEERNGQESGESSPVAERGR